MISGTDDLRDGQSEGSNRNFGWIMQEADRVMMDLAGGMEPDQQTDSLNHPSSFLPDEVVRALKAFIMNP